MKIHYLIKILILLTLSQFALSEKYYVDLALGSSIFNRDDFNNPEMNIEIHKDQSGLSASIIGGVSFNEYISMEVAYNDLGEYSERVNFNSGSFSGSHISSQFDFYSYSLALIPSYPILNEWNVYAKLGVHNWRAIGNGEIYWYKNDIFDYKEDFKEKENDDDYFVGVGTSYALTDKLISKFFIVYYELMEADIVNYSASLGYKF
ncbi:MAG: outer membrane beta-barrel protein [Pseudomonadales bacterium]|nr:outer membrane beta-barrel protein [Pseudomonadales bacterium]